MKNTIKLSRIVIGAMRFRDRQSGVATVRAAIDAGFNYIDCSPAYCYQSETENSECWVNEAVNHPDYRSRIMISAKCSPGNGGMGLGEFNCAHGFGVRTAAQLRQVFDQSRARLGVEHFDFYQLWTTHTDEQIAETFKPGGWREGLESLKPFWNHTGITTHADSKTIIRFLDTNRFESVTLPLNVINTTRVELVEYCRRKGIVLIAMNPFAGGFLAANETLKELSLRYLLALDGVHPLIGFSSVEEVAYAKKIVDTYGNAQESAEDIRAKVDSLINSLEPRCTACGYCQPCPQGINVGASLSYYNLYKYMGMKEAKQAFQEKQWEDGLRIDRCVGCGECVSRCPNRLDTVEILKDANRIMYVKESC
jgi:predicted aldo/keto reductase-like oxidoreductase